MGWCESFWLQWCRRGGQLDGMLLLLLLLLLMLLLLVLLLL